MAISRWRSPVRSANAIPKGSGGTGKSLRAKFPWLSASKTETEAASKFEVMMSALLSSLTSAARRRWYGILPTSNLTPGVKFDVGRMPYQRLRAADVNEDNNADIITSNFEAASVSVLLADGHGNFTRKDFPVPPDPFGIALADLTGDRHLDIAIVHYSGHGTDPSKNALSVLFGDGKGNFSLAKDSPFSTGHYPGTLAVGDLNSDGIADIVISNAED